MNAAERDRLLTQAVTCHQQGQWQQAAAIYQQLQSAQPGGQPDDNILYLQGTLQLQQGNASTAVDLLAPLAMRHPDSADLQNNLGVACQILNRREQALLAFQAAIKADAHYSQAYQNLGKLLSEVGNWEQAEPCYRAVAALQPENFQAQQEWIQALIQLQRWELAGAQLEKLREKAAVGSREAQQWTTQLAYVRAQQKDYVAAVSLYEQLPETERHSPELLSNLGYLYERIGQREKSLESIDQALLRNPQLPELHNNRGITLRSLHRLEAACAAFREALKLNPHFSLARFNLGCTQLLDRQYPVGWENYEARLSMVPAPANLQALPVWQGEPLAGQKLLVYCDQGFGDAIQFVRFLPRIQQMAQTEIVLQCPQGLVEIFRHSRIAGEPLAAEILAEGASLPPVAARFPLLSCGQLLQLAGEDLPGNVPYLQAPETSIVLSWLTKPSAASEKTLEETSGKTPAKWRIGLCWRGNAGQGQDHVRSMSLADLIPLAGLPQVEWINLQVDITAAEQKLWPGELTNWAASFRSFTETALALKELDLVITVDTAVAHLAGALGHPVWTLLAQTPDWRWHLDREDSPWYPGMKLYRQSAWGDWPGVVQKLKADLEVWLTEFPGYRIIVD